MPDGSSMCPRCGTASSPGERFCRHCGYDLMTPTRPLTSGDARRRVAELSIGRGVSDEIISPLWVLVPLLALVVGFMAGILLLFFDLSTGGFIIFLGFTVAAFLFIYMNYKLIAHRPHEQASGARGRPPEGDDRPHIGQRSGEGDGGGGATLHLRAGEHRSGSTDR